MAYTYKVETDYRAGIPQTAFLKGAGPFRGIACHWTAGGPGLRGAKQTIQFFIDAAYRNASYHELWWWENKTFGVIRIVRPDRASHGLNPHRPPWEPNSLVKRILGDKVYDPNRYVYQVSFAGMPDDLKAAMRDPDFVKGATRRIKELYAEFRSLASDPLFNHGEGQPSTRYDWGTELRPAIYAELRAPQESDEPEMLLRRVQQDWTTKGTHEFWTEGPELGQKKFFTEPTRVRSVFEEVIAKDDGFNSGAWRIIEYNGEGLYIHRNFIDPIPNTRIPASGWGPWPEDSDTTVAELQSKLAAQAEIIANQKTEISTLGKRITNKNTKADEIIADANALKKA